MVAEHTRGRVLNMTRVHQVTDELHPWVVQQFKAEHASKQLIVQIHSLVFAGISQASYSFAQITHIQMQSIVSKIVDRICIAVQKEIDNV